MKQPKSINEAAEMLTVAADYLESNREASIDIMKARIASINRGEGQDFSEAVGVNYKNLWRDIKSGSMGTLALGRAIAGTRGKFGDPCKDA